MLAPPGLEAATLLQDTFSRGSVGSAVDLAGSSPDAGSQWSALYQYRLSPLRQVAVTGTAETNGTIANFGNRDLGDLDTTTLFNPAASGAMTLSATLGSSGAAEWSFVGFSTTANSQNDPFNGIGPFILVRPGKFNGDVAEFFTGPIGPSGEASFTSFPISGDTHTASITYDPDTQTVSASLDGMPFGGGATPFRYTYGGANPAAPVINGLAMGLRGDSMGDENPTSAIVSANNPAFGTFDDVLVTQVPEPAAIVLLAIGGVSVLLFFRNGRNGLPIA
ncbi:MAG TPA: PEP-CTERM sorting domain-containing protein [Pirellulales bacterium]